MSDKKEDFLRQYRMSGGTAEDGERMWRIKCRDKAAPDMLTALYLIHAIASDGLRTDDFSSLHQIEAEARAAIAKAEGKIFETQESFQDAVRNDPDMTPERKAKWLSE